MVHVVGREESGSARVTQVQLGEVTFEVLDRIRSSVIKYLQICLK